MSSPRTDANKWAPKLIIVLQLATWSVVGFILLQRGAMSLRGKADSREGTSGIQILQKARNGQVKYEEPVEPMMLPSSHEEAASDSVESPRKNVPARESVVVLDNSTIKRRANITVNERFFRETQRNFSDLEGHRRNSLSSSTPSLYENSEGKKAIFRAYQNDRSKDTIRRISRTEVSRQHDHERARKENWGKKLRTARERDRFAENGSSVSWTDEREIAPAENSLTADKFSDRGRSTWKKTIDESIDLVVGKTILKNTKADQPVLLTIEDGPGGNSSTRLSPVNQTGAGIAIGMLAIGIVMLLLGPVIVIVRAFDARRRRRRENRCSKAASRGDLPPSYEQATLMDQIPSYSTLCLDTIDESSIPPERTIVPSSTRTTSTACISYATSTTTSTATSRTPSSTPIPTEHRTARYTTLSTLSSLSSF